MKTSKLISAGALLAAAALTLVGCSGEAAPQASGDGSGYRVALSMSYTGNDWQATSRNLITAAAEMDPLKDKVAGVDVFVSGDEAQNQISQLQQMIAQKYDAIIVYPISPTALNQTIKMACDSGIKVFAYDATVTEPCAYNVTYDQAEYATKSAEHLSKLMGNKGNVVMITGVAGTSTDEDRNAAAIKTFEKNGIKVLDQCAGDWAQGPSGECMSRFLAAFDNIDGVWSQAGGVSLTAAFDAANRPYVPILSEGENAWRLALADPAYAAKGLVGASVGSPQYQGVAALHLAVDALEGKDVEHNVNVGFGWVTQDEVKVCETGSLAELEAGCNAFAQNLVSPGFFADWFSEKWTPGMDLSIALSGKAAK